MAKTLSHLILEQYPELEGKNIDDAGILLQNDLDGTGDYIAAWNYSATLTDSLKSYLR